MGPRRRQAGVTPALIGVLFLATVVIAGGGEEDMRVLPGQVLSSALAHSKRLKTLDRGLDAAKARADESRAQGLPLLNADARAARYTGIEESRFGPAFTIPAIETRYSAGVQVSQPLYTGGRIRSAREVAEHQKTAATHERRGAEADLVLHTLSLYWSWSKAFYMVESLQAGAARMEAHAKDMQHLHQAGLATDNDSLATDVMLDRTRLRLDEAKRRVDLVAARITFLTGQPMPANGQPLRAAATLAALAPSETLLFEQARANRAERAGREIEVRAAEAQVKALRGEYHPQVSLVGRYEYARPNLMNIPPQDEWQEDGFIGLSVSWNLFDWGLRRAKVAEGAARSAQARLRLEQTEDQIALEVREARINIEDARQRVTVAGRVVESARRNLQAATDLWRNGLTRHSELLDAHAQLTDSEYELIAAAADLETCRAALDHATGLLRSDGAPAPERATSEGGGERNASATR